MTITLRYTFSLHVSSHDYTYLDLRRTPGHTPLASPHVGGFGFVATPSPAPGIDASPFTTWGNVMGTPMRIDDLPIGGTRTSPCLLFTHAHHTNIHTQPPPLHWYRTHFQDAGGTKEGASIITTSRTS